MSKRYVFFCHQDGKNVTKHPDFKKFRRGDFIAKETPKTVGTPRTQKLEDAEVYPDYKMIFDVYDDFAMADMFWPVLLEKNGPPETAYWAISGDITKSRKDVLVPLDFSVFWPL